MNRIVRPDGKLLTVAERRAAGQALRHRVPRGLHAEWTAPPGRADPLALLARSELGRIDRLVALRHARMRADPFAFMRGAACLMAADLGGIANTGLFAQSCGDAHWLNFGALTTADGAAVFDITDFDETLPAPFEWDLKRLATSLAVTARLRGLPDKATRAIARRAAHAYRRHMHDLACVAPLDAWGWRIDLEEAIEDIGDRDVRKRERQLLHHSIEVSRGDFRMLLADGAAPGLRDRPPKVFRLGPEEPAVRAAFAAYARTLPLERRMLVERYRLCDVAFKAVGIGSMGTLCAIGLFATADRDTLLLQVKEAGPSVLAPYAGASDYAHQGHRVVSGQKSMQAAPDPFLGYARAGERDFYVRQLKDPRMAAVDTSLDAGGLAFRARLCGRTLARAHARTGDPAWIAGYLGEGDAFDTALAEFALGYAAQNEADYQAFQQAIRDHRIDAGTPVAA